MGGAPVGVVGVLFLPFTMLSSGIYPRKPRTRSGDQLGSVLGHRQQERRPEFGRGHLRLKASAAASVFHLQQYSTLEGRQRVRAADRTTTTPALGTLTSGYGPPGTSLPTGSGQAGPMLRAEAKARAGAL